MLLVICMGKSSFSAVPLPSTFQVTGLPDLRSTPQPTVRAPPGEPHSSISRAKSYGYEKFLPKVIINSLLDFFFSLENFWVEALTFCVEATLGSEEEEEKVRSDGEKRLLGL